MEINKQPKAKAKAQQVAKHKLLCETHIDCPICKTTTCAILLSKPEAEAAYSAYGCLVCDNLFYKR